MVPDNTIDAAIDDAVLTRHLLGMLPEEETERLDRMSITEEDLAWRIRAAEDDLVDAWVRGEVPNDQVPRFREKYLSLPLRRRKVAIAEALHASEMRGAVTPLPPRNASRNWRAWAVAAAIAAAVPAAYLLVVPRVEETPVVVRSVPQPRPASPATATVAAPGELAQAPAPAEIPPAASPRAVSSVSFLLAAPTRAAGAIEELEIAAGVDRVALRLQLELDDFDSYRGELRDLRSGTVVWRGSGVRTTKNAEATVRFDVPRTDLESRRYAMELYGLTPGEPNELIASYPFRVSTKPAR